jgi:hypothetical protein
MCFSNRRPLNDDTKFLCHYRHSICSLFGNIARAKLGDVYVTQLSRNAFLDSTEQAMRRKDERDRQRGIGTESAGLITPFVSRGANTTVS